MVHEVLEARAKNGADRPALRVKRNGGWRTTTWGSYARDAKRAGRAFNKLGVEPGQGGPAGVLVEAGMPAAKVLPDRDRRIEKADRLVEEGVIRALYAASAAGVRILSSSSAI